MSHEQLINQLTELKESLGFECDYYIGYTKQSTERLFPTNGIFSVIITDLDGIKMITVSNRKTNVSRVIYLLPTIPSSVKILNLSKI